MTGHEHCTCGHKREQHLQRSREHRPPSPARSWIDDETPQHRPKLSGCLLCSCSAFKLQRVRPLR